ncbi:MAG: riboflavin synthase [Elusimicrobia bacterium]|nr:riboflavin synthase [Elusimicrobiota bacterium]
MFSGIIEGLGKIKEIKKKDKGLCFFIQSQFKSLIVGESISIDGVCLTVIEKKKVPLGTLFKVDASEETLKKTTLKDIKTGSLVNLERSLQIGSRLGGHFVQGHVDSTGELTQIEKQGNSKIYNFSYPKFLDPCIVPKGSIAVNGVSLTIVDAKNKNFSVSIIPYTEKNTNLGEKKISDKVNLEADILSKIILKQTQDILKFKYVRKKL